MHPTDVQKDLLRAKQVGKLQVERFLEERSKSNVGFCEKIRKNMLKAFTSMLATTKNCCKRKRGSGQALFQKLRAVSRRYKKGHVFTTVKLKRAPLI